MNALKTIGRNAVLFAIGGTIYYMIELIWRGYSSLPMVLVGGLCFLFCGSINEFLRWDMLIWKQMFICAVGITAIEFLSLKCIFNFQLARVNSSLIEITSAHIYCH